MAILSDLQITTKRNALFADQDAPNLVKIIFKTAKSQSVGLSLDGGSTAGKVSSSKVISSWINADLSLNGTASSSPINELGLFKAMGKINTYSAKAKGMGNNIITQGIESARNAIGAPPAGTQIGGAVFTEEVWSGSSKPAFNLNLIFVNTDSEATGESGSSDIMNDCAFLMGSILPIFTSDSKNIATPSMLITPPEFFAGGNIDVKIGKWFYAKSVIITGVNATFSKETVSTGQPLYAQVNVAFKSFKQLSSDNYQEWFLLRSKTENVLKLYRPGS